MEKKVSLDAIKDIWKSTQRLWGIIWEEKRGLALSLGFVLLLLSAAPFLRSGSQALLINELVKSAQTHMVGGGLLLLIAFVLVTGFVFPIINDLQFYLLRQFWFFLEEKFSILVLTKKGEIDVAVHEDPEYSNLFNKVRDFANYRIQNFSDRQFFIFQNILEVAVSVLILSFAGPLVLIALVLANLPELYVAINYGHEAWGIYGAHAEVRKRYWDLQEYFDWLPWLTELKLFQNTSHFISLAKDILVNFHAEQHKAEQKKLRLQMASVLISQLITAAVIVWLILRVVYGQIQIGTFIFFIASIYELRQSLSGLFSNIGKQYEDGLFLHDVFTLLDIKSKLEKPTLGIILSPDKTPEISFKNVTFRYPGTDKMALKNFSITIHPGEKIALVGANGAGKTTFVKLLCRFYDPDEGQIMIDGHDLKKIDLQSWYELMGALFQDYSQYHFLVKEAIKLGRLNDKDSFEKIRKAAESSEADSFIEEWTKQYEQMLGKQFAGGVEPSIGQWQKLALARAFYRDPRILILDEPTSSIDAEAEAKIFEKLESLPGDRTVLLISHRFSTVRQANRICVLEDGAMKELGTHKALLKRKGLYARLFNLQAKGYK